jgi:CPA1 family monovalent cation:H+ antiporter
MIAILEGESLVNDASGLIVYKYALAAIMAGNFVFWQAGVNFLVVIAAGVAIGLGIAYCMRVIHRKFISDPVIEVTLTFLTPFAAYLLAEYFHVSGVLAVVSCGLYLSFHSAEIFTHQSRIMTYAVWDVVVFILNGLIFILIGLQLRYVVEGIRDDYSLSSLLLYGICISLLVIVVRFIWALPSLMLPRLFPGSKKKAETIATDPRNIVLFGWSGMRGVVSMAAAFSLPLLLPDGSNFPHRNLVIYLTFCVILSTLVLLGFTLPWIIRKMKLEPYSIVAEEYDIRMKVVSSTIGYIEENLSQLNDELLNNLKNKYEVKFNRLQKTDLPPGYFGHNEQEQPATNLFNQFSQLQIDLIAVERQELEQLHKSGGVSEEILRKIERELDLEESRLQMEMYAG